MPRAAYTGMRNRRVEPLSPQSTVTGASRRGEGTNRTAPPSIRASTPSPAARAEGGLHIGGKLDAPHVGPLPLPRAEGGGEEEPVGGGLGRGRRESAAMGEGVMTAVAMRNPPSRLNRPAEERAEAFDRQAVEKAVADFPQKDEIDVPARPLFVEGGGGEYLRQWSLVPRGQAVGGEHRQQAGEGAGAVRPAARPPR